MSAQEYANKLEDIMVQQEDGGENETQQEQSNQPQHKGTNQNDINNPKPNTSSAARTIHGKIRKAKERRVEESENDEDEEGDGNGEGDEDDRNQQVKKKARVSDIEHLINSPVNGGALTGLGKPVEDMNEPVHVELGHKKWIHNIQAAACRFDTNQLKFLKDQYKECRKLKVGN
ncbi:uncharacterized protein MELLADRAFT_103693 [Melampsora larici-populina 98AG31]|uniref:Uncharacterized protein n=1 Tax=Melampsora larici-populina (strain 98AG31 / pathotype 3-4-7) TaxID=747676 RepID=F4RCN0_MELLP|nr:uncharacterized protein MELLADRAFT_103693 [Melampsora larici-populina 98AG31]EGG09660.1 hypothetical protein MELLADRAFT_103693 [Melampsora larici-populina 98AG31]